MQYFTTVTINKLASCVLFLFITAAWMEFLKWSDWLYLMEQRCDPKRVSIWVPWRLCVCVWSLPPLWSVADSLIQQVKEGFGSALLTHLDCLLGFSPFPVLVYWELMPAPILGLNVQHYSCNRILMVIDPIDLPKILSGSIHVYNPVPDVGLA